MVRAGYVVLDGCLEGLPVSAGGVGKITDSATPLSCWGDSGGGLGTLLLDVCRA